MALQKNWTETRWYEDTEYPDNVISRNVEHPNAYIAVDSYNGDKAHTNFAVTVYKNSTRSKIVARRLYSMSHDVEGGSQNVVRQAYLHLKNLPEYEGAEDC